MKGELYFMVNSPVYKRRYAVSSDTRLGCRNNCDFCYYKMIPETSPYFRPAAQLKVLATPEEYLTVLRESRLITERDLILFSARSDGGMIEHYKDLLHVLDLYVQNPFKNLTCLLLRRVPYTKQVYQETKDFPLIYGTTITPGVDEKAMSRVKTDPQIRGLKALREAGCPASRISLEFGPLMPDTWESGAELLALLFKEGLIDFAVYRGGSYGEYQRSIKEMLDEKNFSFPNAPRPKFWNGKEYKGHEFYRFKNYIPTEIEKRFRDKVLSLVPNAKLYRHTGVMYAREYKLPVAITRYNQVRTDMLEFLNPISGLNKVLESELNAKVSEIEPGIYLAHRRGTEDIAHAVGRKYNIALLFTEFENNPTIPDLDMYKREGWLRW